MDSKEFFDEYEDYVQRVMSIQGTVYKNTKKEIDLLMQGANRVLDIGNGGVINYNYENLKQLTCLDISVNQKSAEYYQNNKNIQFIEGNALDLNIPKDSYDVVIIQYVLHHLAGKTVAETIDNMGICIDEAMRVLRGGEGCFWLNPW